MCINDAIASLAKTGEKLDRYLTDMSRLLQLTVLLGSMLPGLGVVTAAETRLNGTIERLAAGEPVLGHFAFGMSNARALQVARSGADFVIIDLEHQPYDVEKLRTFLQQMTNKRRILEKGSLQMDVTPFVRLPTSDVSLAGMIAKQVLNMGAFGLVFPTINTAEEALSAVQASRFPQANGAADMSPPGKRGFEPFQQAMWYWGLSSADYLARADVWPLDGHGELLVVIQIESRAGVDNIDEILKVPGIGAILIGNFDLSVSLGVPSQLSHPDLLQAVEQVVVASVKAGIPVGTTAGSIASRLASGQTILLGGSDARGVKAARAAMESD